MNEWMRTRADNFEFMNLNGRECNAIEEGRKNPTEKFWKINLLYIFFLQKRSFSFFLFSFCFPRFCFSHRYIGSSLLFGLLKFNGEMKRKQKTKKKEIKKNPTISSNFLYNCNKLPVFFLSLERVESRYSLFSVKVTSDDDCRLLNIRRERDRGKDDNNCDSI